MHVRIDINVERVALLVVSLSLLVLAALAENVAVQLLFMYMSLNFWLDAFSDEGFEEFDDDDDDDYD